jgi:exodeoxyribonuclease V alpha subunit
VVADPVGETPCVFLAGLHWAERTIAERLMRLTNGTLPWPWIDPDDAAGIARPVRARMQTLRA